VREVQLRNLIDFAEKVFSTVSDGQTGVRGHKKERTSAPRLFPVFVIVYETVYADWCSLRKIQMEGGMRSASS
jgi:hypothetical protein